MSKDFNRWCGSKSSGDHGGKGAFGGSAKGIYERVYSSPKASQGVKSLKSGSGSKKKK